MLFRSYVGQNGNIALAEILAGKTNPSGKLPITIEKKFEDSPGYPYIPAGQKLYSGWYEDMNMSHPINNIEYKEGVFIGYRWYESKNIQPLYHFGYGLSYTTFEYSDLKSSAKNFNNETGVTIEIKVKNTGKSAGAEVAQLYVQESKPSIARPVKELKGFSKVMLNPGETKTVTIKLSERDFAFWDANQHNWKAEPGKYKIMIGAASNDIRQTIEIMMDK